MKKCTLTIILTVTLFVSLFNIASAQLLYEENFDYPAGDLITNHGWTAHSGGGSQAITVNAGGLTFTGYPGSGIGNAALVDNTGEDDNHVFAVQSAGVVYTAFMVNVVTTSAGYFFNLGGDPISTTYRGRVFVDATNHFGVSVGNSTGTYATGTYTNGTTYLLVLKYEIVAGTNNDIVSLFVFDSAIPSSEPAVPTVGPLTDGTLSDINPGSVALRQYSATQNFIVDGIRVGMTWNDVLPGGVTAPTVQAQNIGFSNVTAGSMDVAWTNGNGSKRVVLINTANSFTNPADGTDPVANPVYGGAGQQVAYNGAGSSVSVSGLTGGTTYWFRVYEYNGSGIATKYLTTTATLNPNSQATTILLTPPIVSTPSASAISENSALLGGTITSNGGSAITERGTVWNTASGVTIADNKLAEGGTGTGAFSHTRSGLPVQTQIFFKAYATNAIGTTLSNESSFYTLSIPPTGHVTGFNATAGGTTSINLSWTAAAPGAGAYLILQRTGAAAPTGIPANGTAYSEGSVVGDGTVAALVTPGATLTKTITGLSSGTTYSFTIIPYTWDGTNGGTCNYFTAPVIPSASATTTGTPSVTYTWQGADNGSWAVATNWNPTRTTPATSDILQFTDGTTKTVTAVPTQSIAKLVLAGNTTVNLQSASAATLTITGGTGADLDIPTGCALNFNAVNAITLNIATTATAAINGSMKFSSTATTAHKLTAADPGAIVFGNGAIFTAGTFFSGNPFGTTSLNSVVFASGSTYLQQAGSNPFGAIAPNSVVVFQTGSLFKVTANLTPSVAGRTYANFEMDATGITLSPTGSTAMSMDNLTVTNGTLNLNLTGPSTGHHQIKGNILVQAGGILNFNPASASLLTLTGSTPQSITANGTLTLSANLTLELDGTGGVTLTSPLSLNGNLVLTNGLFSLGASNLTLSATSAITGTPSASAMIVPTGTGQLRKTFATGFTGSYLFPVGDNTGTAEYSPVTLDFTSGTFAAGNYAGVSLVNAKYPTDPNTNSYLLRYWNVTSSAITAFTCSAVFQYVPADVNGIENNMFSMQVVPTPYTDFSIVNFGLHQVVANNLTTFGTFTGSQPKATVTTKPADLIQATTASLNGEIIARYNPTNVTFEYGLTNAYGTVVTGTPPVVNGGGTSTAIANITGLTMNTTYHFRVVGTNVQGPAYGNDLTFTTLCPAPAAPGVITGPANVCKNGSGYVYTIPAIANATSYTWSVPTGAIITAGASTNSITVSFSGTAVSGNISVTGSNICGTGTASAPFAVTVLPQPVPTVSGPASACINSIGNAYSTETGMTGYAWTVSAGGTITGGATTNNITVTWNTTGAQSVSVTYTNGAGCVAAAPTVYAVNVVALPVPTVTGPSVVCANAASIVYTTEAGMTNYNWNVSIGGYIIAGAGTNAITVSWPYAGNRTVSVSYTNPTGCGAAAATVYNVTINPAAVPTIGSSNDPCINSTNNQYITNSGMLNYTWNVSSGGTITSGQGTNTINVTWSATGAQWVNVSYTNTYGCASVTPTVYNLFVNSMPNAAGTITGTSAVCPGTTGVDYSCQEILNASGYQWTVPAGATIVSGATTNHITVNFGTTPGTGNITVKGTNSCGSGQVSPAFPVTVNPIPATPVVTVNGSVLTSSAPAGNQWYYQGNPIPGATGQTYTVTNNTGYYWCIVTVAGCISQPSNKAWVVVTGMDEATGTAVSVYPVPNTGTFTVSIAVAARETFDLALYNQLGVCVWSKTGLVTDGETTQAVDLQGAPAGVYNLILKGRTGTITRKVVINR